MIIVEKKSGKNCVKVKVLVFSENGSINSRENLVYLLKKFERNYVLNLIIVILDGQSLKEFDSESFKEVTVFIFYRKDIALNSSRFSMFCNFHFLTK